MNDKTELKPCPFCESHSHGWHKQYWQEVEQDGLLYRIFCRRCGASCRAKKTKAEAITAWNTRPSPAVGQAKHEKRIIKELQKRHDAGKERGDDRLFLDAIELIEQLTRPSPAVGQAKTLTRGCIVFMKASSGLVGYGNAQCVSSVCEPLGGIGLFGHNQQYKIRDIEKIVEYPIQLDKEAK
ncbi:hypothetical protein LCGC14_1673280 [marine sediment metagenome]|uniref:Uncharacterized protein n=1 Tax=marine sediment metagenome TaxID=412755 RepID=A0A0F9K6I1_9ZZZZ